MRAKTILSPILWASLLFGACGDDPAEPELALTPAEAEALASLLLGITIRVGQDAYETADEPVPQSAPVTVAFDRQYESDWPCERGGSVAVDASVQGEYFDWSSEADIVQMELTPEDCALQDPKSGHLFMLHGAPKWTVEWVFFNFLAAEGTLGGALTVATGGRSGSCEIDLIVEDTIYRWARTRYLLTASVVGTVCEVGVYATLTV